MIFDFIATFIWVCLLIKQISTQPKKETMKSHCLILLVIMILAPAIAAVDCSGASQSTCGVAGTTCKYYTWNNGSCVPLSSCPTSPTVTVWSNATQNCEECFGASSSICTSCTSYNFYFDTGAAVCTTCANKYGSSCLTCDSAGCISCSANLTLTSDKQSCFNGNCSITHCTVCSNSTTCLTCDSTRTLVNGFCVCQISNCEVCSQGFCTTCNPGYALDSSKKACNFICISNCLTCTNLQSCSVCFTGYYYSSTSNQCLPNCALIDPNCISCSSTTICSACSSNYTLSASQTTCVAPCTDTNCQTCASSSSVCTQCKTGYRVTTFNNCSSDVCSITNCISCASSTTCSTCNTLYTLSSDKRSCTANCNDTNCIYCSSLTTCGTCASGYRISSGRCVAKCTISNCQLCSTQSTCQTCNGGFLLSANSQTCSFNCGILNCVSCASATTCSSCYPGYLLNNASTACLVQCPSGRYSLNNVCVACLDANCANCNTNGVCLSCLNLYYLLSNGTCLSCGVSSTNGTTNCYDCDQGTGTCQTCNNNFYLDSTSKCVAYGTCNVDNCRHCQTTNSTACITCFSGYTLAANSSTCTQLTCSGNQFLVGDVCTCGSKSYLSGGTCVACSDVNCLQCTSTTCLSCLPRYYPSGSSCVACSTNCDTCDSSGCITCTSGYLKSSGACIEPPTTKPVSVSSSGATIICPTGCSTCDLDTSNQLTCRVAADGYALSQGKIYACDISCATCSNTPDSSGLFTNCLTCPTGSNYIAGICTKCTGTNALTCRARNYAYSLSCIPGYTAQKGVCNACTDNCKKCDSVGSLSSNPTKKNTCDLGGCVEGYFQGISSTSCVKCFNGCQVCSIDPSICLACGDYKYLLNNVCYSCPDNCVKCTSTGCTSCEVGYLVSSDGTCKQPNIDGCVSYTPAITCQTCDVNYNLVNGNCQLSIACNANKTCTNCKYNYYLSSGSCLQCPIIANCNSCNVLDSTKCIDCATGYYLNSNSICTACPQTGCTSCTSDTVCTSASNGYYLLVDISGKRTGGVKPCEGYCATCLKYAYTCKSCVSGSTLYGNTCISDKRQDIKFVGNLLAIGNTNVTSEYENGAAISILSSLLSEISAVLKYASLGSFMRNAHFRSFKKGSVTLDYSLNSDSIQVANVNTALTSATFSDITLLSLDVASTTATSSSNVNLGLVLGVSIPLGILLVAIIIILKVKSAKAEEDESGLDGTEKDIENAPAQQF